MRKFIRCCVSPLLWLSFAGLPGLVAAEPLELLAKLPPPYNTVAVVNVAEIMKTPRATQEGWTKLEDTGFLAGVVPLHPGIERYVATSEFTPSRRAPGTSAALVATNRPINLLRLGESLQATPLKIENLDAKLTANGTYLIRLSDQELGAMATSHKPEVARWVRAFISNSLAKPEPYLANAVRTTAKQRHIYIVTDLADLFDEADLDQFLLLSPLLDADVKAKEQVKRFLVGLRGVHVSVQLVPAGLELNLRLDGRTQPMFKAELMKEFVIETLGRAGAEFVDLRAATTRLTTTDFNMTFQISDTELAHVMTLVLPPVTSQAAAAQTLTVAPAEPQRDATLRYLQATNKILDDLKKRYPKATDYGRTAAWHDTSAAQIERLSAVGVQPSVVEYAQGTAKLLRTISASLRGVPVQAELLQANAYLVVQQQPSMFWTPFYGLQWNPWFGAPANVNTNLPEVRRRQAEVIQQDQEKRMQIWQMIESKRAEVISELSR